ncbi:MAG: DNA starvation/stationary phase protection protein Dps [Alphaproteobacteria bacterium]
MTGLVLSKLLRSSAIPSAAGRSSFSGAPAQPARGPIFFLSQSMERAMHPTRNTLDEKIRIQSVELLNKHLATAIDLHAQVKQAHWNVRGANFIAVHKLFDSVSEEVEAFSDLLAERAGGLGGTADGTIQVAAERTSLIVYPLGIADEQKHIFAVSGALAAFGEGVREASVLATNFGDVDTADLFTQVSRGIDLQLWFVESHLANRID